MSIQRKRTGIIGGPGAPGAADIFFELVQAKPIRSASASSRACEC
jgi:hypothetical protein